jgi:hypothetical protein
LDNHQKNHAEFENFLKCNRLVPPEKARFYVYWVDRFLKYYQYRPSKPLAQIVSSYLETMETDSRFADWQVKQAADAILLYADKYLKPKPSLSTNGSIELSSLDRTTDKIWPAGKKYSTNCTRACGFDIIPPGLKNPIGSGSTSSRSIGTIATLCRSMARM